jgi:hypothetical protein
MARVGGADGIPNHGGRRSGPKSVPPAPPHQRGLRVINAALRDKTFVAGLQSDASRRGRRRARGGRCGTGLASQMPYRLRRKSRQKLSRKTRLETSAKVSE